VARWDVLLAGCNCFSVGMALEEPIRVWVDDANVVFRRGLASCLSREGVTVVGESALLDPTPDLRCGDILVLDMEQPDWRKALELARRAPARLIGLVRVGTEELLFDAVQAGLSGFLVRSQVTPEGLLTCLRGVASGNGSLPFDLLTTLFDELAGGATRGASASRLAPRELKVLRLLADGGDTRDIARELCYSERTIKNIVHDVLVKMNCRTRAHAVALATRQGFI
jgi:DNA-binding NarL/FixJ family response regulator